MAGKVIFHIDLNSFYASAELLKNSALEGQPVVVAGLHRRSVVSTASYEARSFGVHSAMPLHMALEKCPDLVVVQGDFAWYEPACIDECYIDVTELIKSYKRPLDLAWSIQHRLYDELHLPCSIGVGPNKFLAKMASDMRKPMGITVLRRQEIARKMWPLPITQMWGIGSKSAPILSKHGIETIGDLADPVNETKVMTLLGKHSYQFIQNARGYDKTPLSYNRSVQSISQSTTLDRDIQEYEEIRAVLARLAESLSRRAKEEDVMGSLISVSIRYFDFTNMVRSLSLETPTRDAKNLLENALLLFDRNHNDKAIRHLGIGLGSLTSSTRSIQQLNLFETKVSASYDVVNELNKQFPKANLKRASDIK